MSSRLLRRIDVIKKFALFSALMCAITTLSYAQMGGGDKSKRPSPPANAQCKFSDGKTIKVDYSSPRAKGRKIFGTGDALVPSGQIWRTGANESTTFVTDTNLSVGGKSIPAGSYTLFTVPDSSQWTLVISKKTGEWGTDYPGEKEDLLRAPMTVSKTTPAVENFAIDFDQAGGKCTMHLSWETTRASAEFSEQK